MTEIKNSYGTLLDTQKSDTTATKYEIHWNKEDGYHCECIGWRKGKDCKHVRRFQFKQEMACLFSVDWSRESLEGIENTILESAREVWGDRI